MSIYLKHYKIYEDINNLVIKKNIIQLNYNIKNVHKKNIIKVYITVNLYEIPLPCHHRIIVDHRLAHPRKDSEDDTRSLPDD